MLTLSRYYLRLIRLSLLLMFSHYFFAADTLRLLRCRYMPLR